MILLSSLLCHFLFLPFTILLSFTLLFSTAEMITATFTHTVIKALSLKNFTFNSCCVVVLMMMMMGQWFSSKVDILTSSGWHLESN